MAERAERVVSAIVAIAAVVVAGIALRREVLPQPSPSAAPGTPTFVADWKDVISTAGRVLGPETAPVKLVEFADLECPFCRRYQPRIQSVLREFPKEVSLVYVHFPIPGHRFARPAARAAECAGREGLFLAMVDAVFAKQDSLGLRSWTSFAVDAGVRDTVRFAKCNADTTTIPSMDIGLETGRRIGVTGTPSMMINGWLIKGVPTEKELSRVVVELLKGREPYTDAKDR